MSHRIKNSNRIKYDPIGAVAALVALLALMVIAGPAWATDPVYPIASRVGLVPPSGMTPSKTFEGFEDRDNDAAIYVTALPAAAYAELEKSAGTDTLKKEGLTVEKREPMQLSVGKGFLVIGTQVVDNTPYRKWVLVAAVGDITAFVSAQVSQRNNTYSEDVIRAALASLSVRANVPDEERLSLLPFTVHDLAGFHVENVLPGRALILSDAPGSPGRGAAKPASEQDINARLLIAAVPGGPKEPDDYAHFARLAFDNIAGISNVQVTMSEPLRIGGQSGFQTMAQAKAGSTGTDVMVVQWLRFGSSGFLQMIGISRTDIWTGVLSRLRTVRDSIEPK
jgi:hypothetical protein